MRIADSLIYRMTQSRLEDARERNFNALARASNGMRVEKPSDDPVAAALARRETNRIARSEAVLGSIVAGTTSLQAADAALDETSGLLNRARELAIQAGNDTLSAAERMAIAYEIGAIRAQVVAQANTREGDTYVFGGYIDNQPPFDSAGVYSGDSNVRQQEVAPGVRISTGVSGDVVFGAAGGTDVLQTLSDLETALQANDANAIRALIDPIEASNGQVISARAQLGASLNAFQVAQSTTERLRDRSVETRAALVEIDPLDAFTELSRAEQALQAAVTVASRIPVAGLIDT